MSMDGKLLSVLAIHKCHVGRTLNDQMNNHGIRTHAMWRVHAHTHALDSAKQRMTVAWVVHT